MKHTKLLIGVKNFLPLIFAITVSLLMTSCGNSDEPDPVDDPEESEEDLWNGETPFHFIWDVTDAYIWRQTDEGYVKCNESIEWPMSRYMENLGFTEAPVFSFGVFFTGTDVDPFHNTELFSEMCMRFGAYPETGAINIPENFPELAELPAFPQKWPGTPTLQSVIDFKVISHDAYDDTHPAGSEISEQNYVSIESYQMGVWLKDALKNPAKASDLIGWATLTRNKILEGKSIDWFTGQVWVSMYQNPSHTGDFRFTIYIYLDNGVIVEKDFKVRVGEGD